MRSRTARFGAALSGAVILTLTVLAPPPAVGGGGATGLWPRSFKAGQAAADCGRWRLDQNGFCVANDARNGLEVGVKFRASRTVRITGVRIYRFDTAPLRASLWNSSGRLLARGKFAPGPASAWQDMRFSTPVTIAPGRTYVASYFTPNTKYAFRYDYFARSARTVGPVTALRSTDSDPNGVHCYEGDSCGSFPVHGHHSSTYWVTPLWTDAPAASGTASAPAPRVVAVTPTALPAAKVTARVHIAFSKAMRRSTLTSTTVRLMHRSTRISTRLTYNAARRLVILTPRARLRPGTTYRIVVTTRVLDSHGIRLDQNARRAGLQSGTWTFHTRR